MEQKRSISQGTIHLTYPQKNASTYKKSLAQYYITQGKLIKPYSWPSMPSPRIKKSADNTQAAAYKLLEYLAKHPDATIRYHESDMILHIPSDVSYLSMSKSLSQSVIFYCGDKPPQEEKFNGSILNVAVVIKNVVSSA